MALTTVRFLVSGRVQGVGFRWYVQRRAEALGLLGWARNRPDGRVEVVVEGEPAALADLAGALEKGPPMARVETVERAEIPHQTEQFKSFTIR